MKTAVYAACYAAAKSMGDRIRGMSWFGKNHAKVCPDGGTVYRLPTDDRLVGDTVAGTEGQRTRIPWV